MDTCRVCGGEIDLTSDELSRSFGDCLTCWLARQRQRLVTRDSPLLLHIIPDDALAHIINLAADGRAREAVACASTCRRLRDVVKVLLLPLLHHEGLKAISTAAGLLETLCM